MAKQGSSRGAAKQSSEAILAAATRALGQVPAGALTVDAVAREAGCAKGLIHYHFKTKSALLAAAAARIWHERQERWVEVLGRGTPDEAISRSWQVLIREAENGTVRACASLAVLPDELTVQSVRQAVLAFSDELTVAVEKLFRSLGLAPSVAPGEIARLTTAVICGMGLQLAICNQHAEQLEGSYAAFWAGVLSLTRPAA